LSTSTNAPEGPVAMERRGSALLLTICRPEAGNSVDLATAEALSVALRRAQDAPNLRAVILSGQGNKFFCTGGDVKAYRALQSAELLEGVFGRVRDLLDQIESFSLPVLAAIDGYALGGGLELALACDQRFASSTAKLGVPQARLGLIPGWNGIERLVEIVGRSHALRLLLSAEPIPAQHALSIGLVDDVATQGTALERALEFVEQLDRAAPLAIAAAKAVCLATLRRERGESRETARRTFERLWFSEDHRDAEAAFAEKRTAVFKGR
jgi:enoyl-CoA hydratase